MARNSATGLFRLQITTVSPAAARAMRLDKWVFAWCRFQVIMTK